MKLKTLFKGMMLLLILFSATASFAQQGDQAEMMKKWQEYMTPGTVHKSFAKMAGNWNAVVTNYMGGQEMKSEGTAFYEMILGGRYLKSTFKSSMMGMPMEGFGLDGYDNASKEYLSVWADNFGTGIMYLKGKMDEQTKNIIYTGTMVDPMTGKDTTTKTVMKYIDNDHTVMEMYMVENGKDVKNMRVEYTRTK
jgi:hypothetical protein